MSLLGPRPPLTYHPWPIEEYTEEQLHTYYTDLFACLWNVLYVYCH